MPLVIQFDFASFADYWAGFETGQGRAGAYLKPLDEEHRNELTRHVRAAYLGGGDDGPRSFSVIIRVARGMVP